MRPASTIDLKIVYALAKARKPMRLVEIARDTGLAKSHVLYYLRRLIEDNIVIPGDETYTVQPFYIEKDMKDDLGSLAKVLISLLAKEMVIDQDATEEQLGEQILQNVTLFIRLYKEGLFS